MLQLNILREKSEWVKERLKIKNFNGDELVDRILQLDEERKKLQLAFDNNQATVNSHSKLIGRKMAAGEKAEAEKLKQEVAELKPKLMEFTSNLEQTEKLLQEVLVQLPNLPDEKVPPGKSPEENQLIRQGGSIPQLPENALPHWELVKQYQLIDFDLGTKITGSGFPVYIGKGALLQRRLINYFLEFNTAAGYTEYLPPLLVNAGSAYATGQLPDKEGQMYHATEDDFYLIPTAEVPLTNIFRGELLKTEDLPVKMTGYTPCFRREAGSYGKDVRGLNRLHQFDKVEIVQIVEPEKSSATLEEMVAHVEQLLINLELPYRILRLCGGDMGFASAITYDFEVYSAAQQKWLEVSSVSNFDTFQSNRMKLRFKDAAGKNRLPHTLNGSSLALPRIVACLLENNQHEDGIHLPAVLGDLIIS